MLITERQFDHVTALRQMIAGFRALFGVLPEVRIVVIGPNGGCTSALDHLTNELVFFPFDGLLLDKIGNAYLTLKLASGELVRVSSENAIEYRARFYLP